MKHLKNLLGLLLCSLFFQSCEISHSVPFDFPDYKPELIIHAVASPQSGATALIKYNQPAGNITGEVPDLPSLEVYLLEEGQRIHRFQQDSITIVDDNQYQVETAHFSIIPDSVDLREDLAYALQIIDQNNLQRYESSDVFLPPKPEVKMLNIECIPGHGNCTVNARLGPVSKPISAISIKERYLDTAIIDNYYRPYNSRLFNRDLYYPDVDSWIEYLATSSFRQVNPIPPDSVVQQLKVRLSIAYLSRDLTQLIREINSTHAIGEDIFATLRPFRSNFSNAFGVFGLYNEDVREIEL